MRPGATPLDRGSMLSTATAGAVLVVENDPDQRRRVATQLAHWGYRPVPASSAEQALALVGRIRFAFSIVAIRLPGMSGVDLLRRTTPGAEAGRGMGPVIVVADDQPGAAIVQAIQAGAHDFIRRPYIAEDLENAVRGLTAKIRAVPAAPAANENGERPLVPAPVTLRAQTTGPGGTTTGLSLKDISRRAVQQAEREVIRCALEQCGWNRVKTARLLHISYRALLYKIKDMGLKQD